MWSTKHENHTLMENTVKQTIIQRSFWCVFFFRCSLLYYWQEAPSLLIEHDLILSRAFRRHNPLAVSRLFCACEPESKLKVSVQPHLCERARVCVCVFGSARTLSNVNMMLAPSSPSTRPQRFASLPSSRQPQPNRRNISFQPSSWTGQVGPSCAAAPLLATRKSASLLQHILFFLLFYSRVRKNRYCPTDKQNR